MLAARRAGDDTGAMRRLSRILLLALLVVIAGFYPLLTPTADRIDQAHFELIQVGMTRAEVEAIFGVPPGQYGWAEQSPPTSWIAIFDGTASTLVIDERINRFLVGWKHDVVCWVSRHGAFAINFDADGRVGWTSACESRIVPPWQRWWKAIWDR
jgi:hypothetical protein